MKFLKFKHLRLSCHDNQAIKIHYASFRGCIRMNIFIYTPTIDTLPPHQQPCEAKEDEDGPEDSHPLFGSLPHLCIRQLMCESVHWKQKDKNTAQMIWIGIVGFRILGRQGGWQPFTWKQLNNAAIWWTITFNTRGQMSGKSLTYLPLSL